MKLPGSSQQQIGHYLYRADGTITSGGTAQVILGRSQSRSYLYLQNNSAGPLYAEIGTGGATATLTSGVVTSVTVTNAGIGFSNAPLVRFLGGGNAGNGGYTGLAQPGGAGPNSVLSKVGATQPVGAVAIAHCVMTGSAPNQTISSIVVDYGGAGYVLAPFVLIINSDLDPNGAAIPSNGVGILLGAGGGSKEYNGTVCPTDPVAIWGPTTGQAFTFRWMD
jgi:hypothetical protein